MDIDDTMNAGSASARARDAAVRIDAGAPPSPDNGAAAAAPPSASFSPGVAMPQQQQRADDTTPPQFAPRVTRSPDDTALPISPLLSDASVAAMVARAAETTRVLTQSNGVIRISTEASVAWAPHLLTVESEVAPPPRSPSERGDDVQVCTDTLIATARARGWNAAVLGRGQPFGGVWSKIGYYTAALRGLPSHALVVLSDGRDVVCPRGPEGFLETWLEFGAPIVVSMERFCDGMLDYSPNPVVTDRHCASLEAYWTARGVVGEEARAALPRRFVNSGLIAGRADALRHYLAWAASWAETQRAQGNPRPKDQMALGSYMERFPSMVAADIHAKLLHTSGAGCYDGRVDPRQASDASAMEFLGHGAWLVHIPGVNVPAHAAQKALLKWATQITAREAARPSPMAKPLRQGQPFFKLSNK